MTDTTDISPEKIPLTSLEIAEEKRELLKKCLAAAFPEALAEGKIDFDQLKRVLGEWVEPDRERFGLNWPGKAACMKVIQAPSVGTLKPCPKESVNWDTTENLFIEGDNLEVLKLLQKAYFGKVKMIYIDPPYNTGKEFIYPDKYSETLDTYLEYTGQKDSEGHKFATNSETSGRFHSKWLSMMYPRLYLAKNLLCDDGVIACHIDENEQANAEKLFQEIFGEENILGIAVWDKRNPKGDATKLAYQHESIIFAAKNQENFADRTGLKRQKKNAETMMRKGDQLFRRMGRTEAPADLEAVQKKYKIEVDILEAHKREVTLDSINKEFASWIRSKDFSGGEAAYNKIDEEGNVYRLASMAWPNKKSAPAEYFIPLKHPRTGQDCPVPERGWRNPPATMKKLMDEGEIVFGADHEVQPQRKYLLRENMNENFPSILAFGGSDDALLSNIGIPFDNPKPVEIAHQIISSATDNRDIVMDFFAGSGTVGHAVMAQTRNDGKSRNFILVQLPEQLSDGRTDQRQAIEFCDEMEKPRNLAEVAKERLRRVASKYIRQEGDLQADFGFRSFKLDRSCFGIWNGESEDVDDNDLMTRIAAHGDHVYPSATAEEILFELLLKDGFPLTVPMERIEVAGKEVFSIAEGALLICLDKELTQELMDAIAEMEPARVICLDVGFRGNDQLKANAVQTFKARARTKETTIEFRTV